MLVYQRVGHDNTMITPLNKSPQMRCKLWIMEEMERTPGHRVRLLLKRRHRNTP